MSFSINESDAITAVSNNLKEETYKNFDIEKDIHVIYNFVDENRFKKTDKEHFKQLIAPNNERILVHVSNFRKVKRVEDVISAFEIVRREIPSKLLMVGDGPERQTAQDLCRKLNTCNDIRFLGKQEQLEDILSISDLFILPSQYESFGLAALEAMACGLPLISSNAGGLPEINIDGYSGYLSDVGDYRKMAADAISILKDQDTLDRFKTNALEQSSKFAIEKIVPQYEALYTEVVAKSKL